MAGQAEQEKVEQALAILNIAGSGPTLESAVLRALAEPGLFVYGELLDLPSMQQLLHGPQDNVLKTLQLFAYGTFSDHQQHRGEYLTLSEQHLRKLKQLTVCTLASEQVLPYKTLLQALELPDVRSLEDFIIQGCIYPGLIKCKFDQKAQCLHVQDVYSRDVRPERIAELSSSLEDMLASVRRVMGELQQNVADICEAHESKVSREADFEARLEESRKSQAAISRLCQSDTGDGAMSVTPRADTSNSRPSRPGRSSTRPDAKKVKK